MRRVTLATLVVAALAAQEAHADVLCWPWQSTTYHRIVQHVPNHHRVRHPRPRVHHVGPRHRRIAKSPTRFTKRTQEIACPTNPPVGPLMTPLIAAQAMTPILADLIYPTDIPSHVEPDEPEVPSVFFPASTVGDSGGGEYPVVLPPEETPITPLPPEFPPVEMHPPISPPTGSIPEPATWLMLIVGFFAVGGMVRGRKTHLADRN